jgi:hypothetical protein
MLAEIFGVPLAKISSHDLTLNTPSRLQLSEHFISYQMMISVGDRSSSPKYDDPECMDQIYI